MELQQIDDLRNKGYYVAQLDGSDCKNLSAFITNIGKSFQFPDYYGNNINAFLECVNDLDWITELNYALVITNSDLFMSEDTDNKLYIIDLLKKVTKEWGNVPNYQGEDAFRHKADFKVIYN